MSGVQVWLGGALALSLNLVLVMGLYAAQSGVSAGGSLLPAQAAASVAAADHRDGTVC